MSFSEQLKKARLAIGYTQQKVADLMGITKSTYCGYETGKRKPDVLKIKQLAKILETSGDILLETGFEKEKPFELVEVSKDRALSETPEQVSDDELLEIAFNSFKELKPEYQEYVLKQIDQLLDMQVREKSEKEKQEEEKYIKTHFKNATRKKSYVLNTTTETESKEKDEKISNL